MAHVDVVDTSAPLEGYVAPARRARRVIFRRRMLVLGLNVVTVAALMAGMGYALSFGGVSWVEALMFVAYTITLPWLTIGFWNAVIGTVLLARGIAPNDPALSLPDAGDAPIRSRTALVMALRNEDPDASFARLRAMADDVARAGLAPFVDFHVLSDTDCADIAAREERLFAQWGHPRAHYRRRTDNSGYKAGNLEEFCARCGDTYDFFLPLDADSMMSAKAIGRLIRIMEARPRIGILQSLVVGTPATAFFTRVFQFGMRHGMRSYTTGSTWWMGDCGPYWGHNALIRMKPFRDHCKLPVLSGKGPLSGHVMSHDQVEAVLMRRAGYHVRVLVEEGESWEENPPTLPDFIRRELRWCQGNMQYFWLIGMRGLKPVSRLQLGLAIGMYLGAPAWMAFIVLSMMQLFVPSGSLPAGVGVALFCTIMFFALAPKLLGLIGVLARGDMARAYGGRGRVLAGGLLEAVISMLAAPVVGFAIAAFAVGLLFGKKLDWRAQPRADRAVAWGEALRTFWPQTLFGAAIAALLTVMMPVVLPWAAPLIAGFMLSVPLAVATASPLWGRALCAVGVCDIPEDRARPALLGSVAASEAPALTAAQAA